MRLPFFRSRDRDEIDGEGEIPEDLIDNLSLPSDEEELSELAGDEQEKEDEGDEEEEQEEETKEETEKPWTGDNDMLKVFASMGEQASEASTLASEVEDVPIAELLQELRCLATAFSTPSSQAREGEDSFTAYN